MAALFALLLLALLGPAALAAPMGAEEARHLLDRTAFGASPAEVARYAALDRRQAVDRLLTAATTEPAAKPPAEVDEYLAPRRFRDAGDDERLALRKEQHRRGVELRAWWLGEMLAADPPTALREHMTLFWHNHFVSSVDKVKSPKLMLEQNLLLRRHALGNFGQLLHAVGRNPAMVVYLDSATSRRGQPNENFAREVMELFTLGEGHYAEQDVKEAARAFTGWSVDPETGAYKWRPFAHDAGPKTVLGRSGNLDGDDVLDILLARPETAEFVTAKLWREFVSPTPDAGELKRIAGRFRASGYDIKSVLGDLLASPAFWAKENRAALVKSPADIVVGTLRRLEMQDAADGRTLVFAMKQQGQDLFAPPNVKGWPGGNAWINSTTLLAREQFLDRLSGLMPPWADLDRAALLDPAYQLK